MQTDTGQGQHKPSSPRRRFRSRGPTQDLAHRRRQPSVPSSDHAVVVVADPGHLHLCLRRRRGHRKGARPPQAPPRPYLRPPPPPPSPSPSSSMSLTAWVHSAPPPPVSASLSRLDRSTRAGADGTRKCKLK
jgi:hypothetical protein